MLSDIFFCFCSCSFINYSLHGVSQDNPFKVQVDLCYLCGQGPPVALHATSIKVSSKPLLDPSAPLLQLYPCPHPLFPPDVPFQTQWSLADSQARSRCRAAYLFPPPGRLTPTISWLTLSLSSRLYSDIILPLKSFLTTWSKSIITTTTTRTLSIKIGIFSFFRKCNRSDDTGPHSHRPAMDLCLRSHQDRAWRSFNYYSYIIPNSNLCLLLDINYGGCVYFM